MSESVLFRLGRGISSCLVQLSSTLDEGVAEGLFEVDDTTLLANYMYSTGFGALQLARVGMVIQELEPGIPTIALLSVAPVRRYLIDTPLAPPTGLCMRAPRNTKGARLRS